MADKTLIIKGRYYDSVTLMNVARRVNGLPGITDSAVVMGTAANKEILQNAGLYRPEHDATTDADLIVVVAGGEAKALDDALGEIDAILADVRKRHDAGERLPRSIESAVDALPGASLALVSVAGAFAADEAMKALERGLHVMLFSDNVPLEREVELKRFAHARGLLVMGPDCGTAIVNGVPLAFANAVKRGAIGAVAAAGTGLQEVTSLISNLGGGISQALGTGGRDVKAEVGGVTFIDALEALAADPATTSIVLVAKPPHPEVMAKIGAAVDKIDKRVVGVFLGADPEVLRAHGMVPAATLEEASYLSVGQAVPPDEVVDMAAPSGKYVRGLFSGGTFCFEAQLILMPVLGEVRSNTPAPGALALDDVHRSVGHTIIDLGDDAFTVGRPHPMIDFSVRNKRILDEARDADTAVILLDLVLGYGANLDPLADLLPTLREVREARGGSLAVVCAVTGTDADPQNRSAVVEALRREGVIVARSNAAACRVAATLVTQTREIFA